MNRCVKCGKERKEWDSNVTIEVQIRCESTPRCDECGMRNVRREWLMFCCPKCLVDYVKETSLQPDVDALVGEMEDS